MFSAHSTKTRFDKATMSGEKNLSSDLNQRPYPLPDGRHLYESVNGGNVIALDSDLQVT